jgi:hypothetical protein
VAWGCWLDSSCELLWTQKWTFRFCKRQRISWLAERLLAFQEGLNYIKLVENCLILKRRSPHYLRSGTLTFLKMSSHEMRQRLVSYLSNILYISPTLILILSCLPPLFLFWSLYRPISLAVFQKDTGRLTKGSLYTWMTVVSSVCHLYIHELHSVFPEVIVSKSPVYSRVTKTPSSSLRVYLSKDFLWDSPLL